jgi:Na+/H+-dicarboxylate symporter
MVMAIVIGVAINLGGTRTTHVKNLFEELDVVCSNLSVMIMSAVPFAVFCSAVSIIVSARVDVVIAALELVLVLVVGVACTAILQLLLLVVTTGLNPLTLLRKYIPAMKKTFLKGSGVAAIPITMRACQRQFGVSRKVSSVTIPLGATINMDGNCVSLTVITLFLSKLYGVTISGGEMLILLFLAVAGSTLWISLQMKARIGENDLAVFAADMLLCPVFPNAVLALLFARSDLLRYFAGMVIRNKKE